MFHDQNQAAETRFWQLRWGPRPCKQQRGGRRQGGREAGRLSSLVVAEGSLADRGLGRLGCGWGWESGGGEDSELCWQGPGTERERKEGGRQGGFKKARLSAGGSGASSRGKARFRQHPESPPLLAPRLPGCTEEQICGVEGFQASHPSSTMNAH